MLKFQVQVSEVLNERWFLPFQVKPHQGVDSKLAMASLPISFHFESELIDPGSN
jgi:hypothetical protein